MNRQVMRKCSKYILLLLMIVILGTIVIVVVNAEIKNEKTPMNDWYRPSTKALSPRGLGANL